MKALLFNVNIPLFLATKALRPVFGRRVFYRGPVKTIRLAEIPEPGPPAPGWVKIRTLACGFCGSDLNLILLHDSPSASPFTSFPCVIGHEMVGEIVETGEGVSHFQPGEMVAVNPGLSCLTRGINPPCRPCRLGRPGNCENYAEGDLPPGMFLGINSGVNGGFAPFVAAHESQLYRIPAGLSLEAAVMTEPVAVALQTVFDNLPRPGEKVLVIGGGVIGNLIIQSIRALVPDCAPALIEPAPFAAEMARTGGAGEVIPAGEAFDRTAGLTGARMYKPLLGQDMPMGGFDRVYDTVGISATLNLGLRLLTAMGTLSMVGIGGDVRLDLTPLWLKLQTIKGVYAYGYEDFDGRRQHVFEIALDMMKTGRIRAEDLVTHRFALDDYRKMIETNLEKQKNRAMKTVVFF